MPQPLTYRVHGLAITSEIPLTGLPQVDSSGEPDVRIIEGTFEDIQSPSDRGLIWVTEPGCFQIDVEGVAKFEVRAGQTITVDAQPDTTAAALQTYLLGSIMGALLHQRELLPLHAGAIETPSGQALLVAGRTGLGKSTLVAALHQRGYPILADDVCAVTLDCNRQAQMPPGLSRVKLTEDSAAYLSIDTAGLDRDHGKGKAIIHTQPAAPGHRPISAVLFLEVTEAAHPGLQLVKGADAIALLATSIYRKNFARGLKTYAKLFPTVTTLGRTPSLYQLHRPAGLTQLESVVDQLEPIINP